MPTLQTDEAILLSTQPLGEADLIVNLLSNRHGKVRGVARSARRSRRRFGGALEPMTRVRATWAERDGRDLQRIDALEVERSFAAMQSEPSVQAACAVLAEIAILASREGDDDPRVYRLLGAVLEALEGGLDPKSAVRYFEFWMLRLHGVLRDPEICSACESALPPSGAARVGSAGRGILCSRCARATDVGPTRRLGPDERSWLRLASARRPEEMTEGAAAARGGEALEWLLRGALEAFLERPLRTYRHLETWTRAASGTPGKT